MVRRSLRLILCISVALLLCVSWVPTTKAFSPTKDKGLLITPLRKYVAIGAGKTYQDSVSIANITSQPMDVTMSYEQFTVANFSYDYQFMLPKENWVSLNPTHVKLAARENRKITYTITIPPKATPGGHYFTVLASTNLDGKMVRTATILYVTVGGDLLKTSVIRNDVIPKVVLYGSIPFKFDVEDTGNTHFFIYVFGKLTGPFTMLDNSDTAHILLPNTVRSVGATIPAPIWPGLYTLTYGYKTEDGQQVVQTRHLVYIPPWVWPILIGSIWLGLVFYKRHQRLKLAKQLETH